MERFFEQELRWTTMPDAVGDQPGQAPPRNGPWSALASRAGNLPPQPTPLIGREREVAELGQLLSNPDVRLLTLTGPAGTGKTRLAIELAARRGSTFQHGTVFVDLAPIRDPALVISRMATALGLLDVGSQPLTETVKLFLRERQLLLVLDNFEQVLAAAPLLADVLAAAPDLTLLVTSRAALRMWRWEHEFPVSPLALPDLRQPPPPEALERIPSVALFVERARARRPGFALEAHNALAVAELCIRLDGLPLAVELAAAGIRLLSPQVILARLQRQLDLPGEGGADFPSRHQTLRAAVGWSYELLSAPEQALFQRLAVFVGGFSLDAVESICSGEGLSAEQILPLLAQLVDQSLVIVEERGSDTRYRLLETIREYASEQLEASADATRYRRQHAEWCVRVGLQAEAELRGRNQSAWLDRLEIDHDNLRAALDWLSTVDSEATRLGLQLASALWQFWWLRGYLNEGRQRLELILARAGPTRPNPDRARALLAAGVLAFRQGDYSAAAAHLGESLERARERGDRSSAASALRNLGRMAIDRAEFDTAHRLLAESLALDEALANPFGMAWSLNYLGLLAHFEGDNATARARIERSLPMLRALDDRWGVAVALAYLGSAACDQGQQSTAASLWIESLETCRAQGYLWCIPFLFEFFGGLAIMRGQPLQGVHLAGAGDALHDSIGAPLPPVWRAVRDRRLAPARRSLDEPAFAAAWAKGRATSLDEAAAGAKQVALDAQSSIRFASFARPLALVPPLETRYARSGDVNIAYQVAGQGRLDVVFVMGWVSHLDYYWQEPRFARFLRRLASFSRLILFDKRGTGLSDRGVGLPTLEQRMDDVRAVLDAVGSERAALLGVSEAGALCTLFAATHPGRTSALVLLGCFPRRVRAPDYPWGAPAEEREQRLREIERDWASLDWARRDLERRAPSVAADEQFVQWWTTYLRMSASPGAAVALMRMNNQIDVRPVLPAIRVPTLVVHRTDDRVARVEEARYLAARVPGARCLELPGEDHLPFVGDQDTLLDEVQEFLTGVRAPKEPDRLLATVLAMEVVAAADGITRVGERSWREIEHAHAAIVREQLAQARGHLAHAVGSTLVATFDGPARAIRCAGAIMDESRALGVGMRAGLHVGECVLLDGELDGLVFRVASAVMARAESDHVLVSSTVRDLVAGSGIQFEERAPPLASAELGSLRLFAVERGHRPERSANGREAPARERTNPLTPRERDVALLVARGYTNRQIGEELVISPATAERHVVNILNKLGFHARSQIATWVTERELERPST